MREASRLPLEGVRVLDISTVIGGPGVAARLGDPGADVFGQELGVDGGELRRLHDNGVI